MGAANSTLVEDKALQLCRERKKFIGQALDARCSLAANHISYIEALKVAGSSLRKFVEPEGLVDSSLYTSNAATSERPVHTEKSVPQFSISSQSFSQHVDANRTISPSPSPPPTRHYRTDHMKFGGSIPVKVEEKPSTSHTVILGSPTSPPSTTTLSVGRPETPPPQPPPVPPESPPWDFFGLSHPIDNHIERGEHGLDMEYADEIRQLEEERFSEGGEDFSSHGRQGSSDSDDEFDEPSTDGLVRSFKNVNREGDDIAPSDSPVFHSAKSIPSKSKLVNGLKNNSPDLTPLRPATSSEAAVINDIKSIMVEDDCSENQVTPKDFLLSMKDIEFLFGKASEAGREVPRMLEANKLHFRPIHPGKENGRIASSILKSCFSCGEDPSQVQEVPPETDVKYLTWHRTTSSRSSSSRNLPGANSIDDIEDLTKNLLDSFSMISRSHASTIDRLYAWERKLYDEVKASEMIRRNYDIKRKLLRQQESAGEKPLKIDKTRAVVKDLHSRITVAIHRIDSISKKIEDLRDGELQPQLEELIEGLRKMWEAMVDCHKLQFHVISVAYSPGNFKITVQSDSRRLAIIYLENDLTSLSSSFTKWITAQKTYIEAIKKWLYKSVLQSQKASKRKKKIPHPPPRFYGPPIYATCDLWLDFLKNLPTEAVVDSMKNLAAEVARFIPHQERNHGKSANHTRLFSRQAAVDGDPRVNLLRDEAPEDRAPGLDQFRVSLANLLGHMTEFAETSVDMYKKLQRDIEEAKKNYEPTKPQ